jgi:fructose-bisphosphate aldolase class II
MGIATPEQYAEMLDRALDGGFAYAAVNEVHAGLRGRLAVEHHGQRGALAILG